ncbi:MAG: hypothetical protein NZ874_00245 [Fimbriimonadales bacterium]|nr:hypothetical protein [Fimbriimonadales bacterium]
MQSSRRRPCRRRHGHDCPCHTPRGLDSRVQAMRSVGVPADGSSARRGRYGSVGVVADDSTDTIVRATRCVAWTVVSKRCVASASPPMTARTRLSVPHCVAWTVVSKHRTDKTVRATARSCWQPS